MNGSERPNAPPNRLRLLLAAGLLTLALAIVFPFFAWYGHTHYGTAGIVSAAVAGAVCWLGATLALVMTGWFTGPAAVQGTLLGMVFRMGLPMGLGFVLSRPGGPLAAGGGFGMILAYYLVALAIETLLSVWLINPLRVSKAS